MNEHLWRCLSCNDVCCDDLDCATHNAYETTDMHTSYRGHSEFTPIGEEAKVILPPKPKAAPAPPCHTGNVDVFSTHGVTVYGGGTMRGASPSTNVVLDLADQYIDWRLPAGWSAARYAPLVVKMEIVDGEVPNVSREFWDELWGDLLTVCRRRGNLSVLAVCVGGHGRTGYVLTALALASGIIPPNEDPVDWVRKHYCEKAVETAKQIDSLATVFGCKITAKPSGTGGDIYGWGD